MTKLTLKILGWINSRKMVSTSCAIAIVGGFFHNCQSSESKSGFNTVEQKVDSLDFSTTSGRIYLSARQWGIAGNHEQIDIWGSKSSDTITLFTSEVYYRKAGRDSMIVYAAQSSIPARVNNAIGEITVHIIGLNTQNEVLDYSANYRGYGLAKLSALDK